MKDKSPNKDLFVANISFEAEEEDLRKLFDLCGSIRSIHMVTDQKSGLFKGCAFVRMANVAQAKDAMVTLDGTYLVDRCISVTPAKPKKTAPSVASDDKAKPQQKQRPRGRRH